MKKKPILTATLGFLTLASLAACSLQNNQTQSTAGQVVQQSLPTPSIDWDSLASKEITLDEKGLTITEAGTYVLKGNTSAGVTVNTSGNVRLILAGAAISSSDGPAINIEEAGTVQLELQDGTENKVSDSNTHSNEDLEGAIHAKADLIVTGSGNLTVEANYQDGIVSTDNLYLENGNIQVTAIDDGIRGRDSVTINGGNISVNAQGDGIKANNDEDTSKGNVTISGGDISVSAGDDGIKAESSLVINDGNISVLQSAEGLEGTNITINGGTVDVYATDDGINAASDITGVDIFIKVTGGNIKVEVGPGDTDAFDSNGNLEISGGTIDITAQSAFDFDGSVSFTGGTVTVNGEKQTEIVQTGPGSPGGMGMQGTMPPGGGQAPTNRG
ncbi:MULTISPECIES: carbohydrate-binding domain-containing protein [unclassified Streptococcus]|uniref:carbohydrate-binding domain-containing protein n=1 Tax=unclassified Streptococcus TaxID=2608887 RepID=UPI00107181A6|nr:MULTISPECIES: carbohydrate-binding domain-containing protein [unclassified Streptococcus]MBF0805922.1 carbohydrate-binding domain-containing protein [Streptococcus sp. 19428wA2_WM07]TFU28495.1 carbohydrate-binding domain-containing protein [Streptococcus sp. WM07]